MNTLLKLLLDAKPFLTNEITIAKSEGNYSNAKIWKADEPLESTKPEALIIQRVSNNEAVLQYETCQKGRITKCKCESDQDCKEKSEVAVCQNCGNDSYTKRMGGKLICQRCNEDWQTDC